MENGKVIYGPVPITSGRAGWRTPPGTFRVTWKDIDHKSHEFNNAPMNYSVFFNGGIAFHEGSLRQPSHGCIHLSRAAAQKYFSSLQVGEIVEVVK
jgi:lipoprotein-anchoring transpeptidase ErfK/SrfK